MIEKFDSVQRVSFIKEICRGKKVLHLGCTNYPYTSEAIENDMLLHFELAKIASELYGFDFDKAGLDRRVSSGRFPMRGGCDVRNRHTCADHSGRAD